MREPEYDAWERAIQVAYDGWRHSLCSDCGQPLQESLLDEKVPPDQRPRYRASFTQCRACEALEPLPSCGAAAAGVPGIAASAIRTAT